MTKIKIEICEALGELIYAAKTKKPKSFRSKLAHFIWIIGYDSYTANKVSRDKELIRNSNFILNNLNKSRFIRIHNRLDRMLKNIHKLCNK